ncbi:TNT domain-containing protein [Roseburia sp. 831b]|uniref:TNT domain-containing protein n=1 Tax=Roseburia sp. 831b TaxID=1261635 RepID=UPI000952E3C1|nr:glycohydrolase toxin TNT-related protein [Roseburia sp. 831b]WVK73182.1 TNT domain-containing protein [Roseburia sp. 831b]
MSLVVATAEGIVGTGTTIFGIADSAEGAQDIYYGSIGDIDSTAVNDLKDVVFQGNEEAYYLTESVFAFAASAMIPIGQAASAGNLTFRSGATIVAKEGIATAAGAGAQKYTTDLTGNQTAGMIAGMAASMATAKGLNGIEAGAKKLAKPKLGDVGADGGAVLNDADVDSAVKSGTTTISSADRIKIDAWDYTPSDELYLKYKKVFDNPKYYNQKTGAINWPQNDGFASKPIDEVLQPGTRIDRYGSDFGSFTSPEGIPYEMRAVAPETDLKPYSVFEVVEPINVKAGEIAPWFDEPGGGIQYLLPDTVDELLDAGILRRIK